MQIVEMDNDMCAVFPEEWEIIYTPYYKNKCYYAGVVWVENSRELPVFVFFWNHPISTMTKKDRNKVLDSICEHWQGFPEYIYYSSFTHSVNNKKIKTEEFYSIHFFDMSDMKPSKKEIFLEGVQAGMYTFWAKHMHHGWPEIKRMNEIE